MRNQVIGTRSLGAIPTLVAESTLEVAEIGPWLGEVYGEIETYLSRIGESPCGPPFARYHSVSAGRFRVEAGFPVNSHVTGSGEVRASTLPGGNVAIITHIGPYSEMEESYGTLTKWIESRGATPTGDAWEVYYSEPTTPPETWRTEIVQPYQAA
jgi:effector-binding domain-containing protein